MANLTRGIKRANKHAEKKKRPALAYLFWSNRCPSSAADSCVAAFDWFLPRRRCDRGHAQAGVSRSHATDARCGQACSCALGIVAPRSCRSWWQPKKDRNPAHRYSAGGISLSRTLFLLRGERMDILACGHVSRQEGVNVKA